MSRNRYEQAHYIQFGTLTSSEIEAFSVCEINRPTPRDGKNLANTPYDHRLGRIENGFRCETCGKTNDSCPGHPGHIVLPIPIYNKIFMSYIVKILQCVCPSCARLRLKPEYIVMLGVSQNKGAETLKAFAKKCEKVHMCPWEDCENYQEELPVFTLTKSKDEIHCHYGDSSKSIVFKAGEALHIFERISNESMKCLGFNIFLSSGKPDEPSYFDSNDEWKEMDGKTHIHQFRPESMIFTSLQVIASTSRPYVVRDGERGDDDLTDKYNQIIKCCNKLEEDNDYILTPSSSRYRRKKMTENMRRKVEMDLQANIWALLDNKDEKSKLSNGGRPHRCLTTRAEGKGGRVQSNIMGKRVDFSARSVIIGGGIDLRKDQLGVPECIAAEESIPIKVKEWNIDYLQKLVADEKVNRVIRTTGGKRNIFRLNIPGRKPRVVLQISDMVERQIIDGDVLVFNRQPTLLPSNMIAFTVKVIPGHAFRLGLCWTKGFNADFDGDEMNGHFPQSIGAQAEAKFLMRAALHLVTSQKNAPINGVVQDGLDGSYILTNTWLGTDTDTMVKKEIFMNCVVGAIEDENTALFRYQDLLSRAHKYYPEYISLDSEGNASLSADEIPGKLVFSILFPSNFRYKRMTNVNPIFPMVTIKNGVVKPNSGPIEKKVIGGVLDSVIHRLWKEYSPDVALQFISETQQLIDRWFPTHGFSMGISDCIATPEAKKEVSKTLFEMRTKVSEILATCKDGIPDNRAEIAINKILNSGMNKSLTVAKKSMNKGDRNALNIMSDSGAKGSIINLGQIVCYLGQTVVAGGRVPMRLSGNTRALPHYRPSDHSAEARGFISGNFIDGLSPQETFFHAIGGREGIVATSIKTADTGYIQKKIGRKMDDFHVEIDGSVRTAYGNIVQFLYGGDGMDPKKLCKVSSQRDPFPVNVLNIATRLNSDAEREETADEEKRHLYSEEIEFLVSCIYSAPPHVDNEITRQANFNARESLTLHLQDVQIYPNKISSFCIEIRDMFEMSRACYGLMVGLIATSAVGEPTTQLTLNSVTRDTLISVSSGSRGRITEIGDFVDQIMNNSDKVDIVDETTEFVALKENLFVPSSTEEGEMMWDKIIGVSRHPAKTKLVKIKTKNGRTVTATKSKSFLRWNNKTKKLEPTKGSDLKHGDLVPVFHQLPENEITEVYLELERYLPKTKWIYGTDFIKASECWKKERLWWKNGQGKTFTLPFKRSDSARCSFENKNKSTVIEKGIVYPLQCNRVGSKIPERINLDRTFGFIVGIYLAEGWATNTFVGISNNDEDILNKVRKWCDTYSITYHTVVTLSKRFENSKSTDLKIHSVILARLFKGWLGTGSHRKRIPDEALLSPPEFAYGLLDGYFSGDGTVNLKDPCLRFATTSEKLCDGIFEICARFGIYGRKSLIIIKRNNVGSKAIKPVHQGEIRNGFSQKFCTLISSSHPKKRKAMQVILDYNFKYPKGRDIKIERDVVLSPIISIEQIGTEEKVYDLTTEKTKNFAITGGLVVRDTFHFSGVGSKDVSLGIPRFKELLNTTDSKKQKQPSCTVFFDIPKVNERMDKIQSLPEENSEEILCVKQSILELFEEKKKEFEETTVGTFFVRYEMKYLPEETEGFSPYKAASPIGIVTYEEYEKEWWVTLHEEMNPLRSSKELFPNGPPESWVIILHLNVEELFRRKVSVEEIANAIEEDAQGKIVCFPSPNDIGKIEVYLNFSDLEAYVLEKAGDTLILPPGDGSSRSSLVSDSNIRFFTARHLITDYVTNIKFSGICGIKSIVFREDNEKGEWVGDLKCRPGVRQEISNQRFLKILSTPGVNPYLTVTDDMHAIYRVLGIEAARKFLFNEILRIISFDGTYINPRHIQLLVDGMTYTGEVTAVQRGGISRREVGPIAKLTFEQPIANATEAALFGECDNLKSVSSSIMYGTPSRVGTGVVDIKRKDRIPSRLLKQEMTISVRE